MKKNLVKKLLYIGPAPQNIGGISVHIHRLTVLMTNYYSIDFIDEGHKRFSGVFNLRSGNILQYLRKVVSADIVHIHSGVWLLRAFHIVVCKFLFRKKVLVTIHRDPTIEPHVGLTKQLLKKCDIAILVNSKAYNAMVTEGNCRYVLLPAFLPPDMNEEPPLPDEIETWIEKVRTFKDSFLMCSNAWNLVMHNGEDLYGLDMCIEAMKHLDRSYFLLFVVASNTDQEERMHHYESLIEEYNLEDNILIWKQPISFVRLLQRCDLVLRTTNTDGDAISIREALYFGKPVLASDVVERPREALLFKTRDVVDLVDKIMSVVAHRGTVTPLSVTNYQALYLRMYNDEY